MRNAGFPTKRKGKLLHSCDGNQFVVKNTGEGEQIVALVLQRDAHRADPPCIFGLAACQFRDEEIEQYLPCRQGRPASARTSWLNHWTSVRTSRASQQALASACRASSNSMTSSCERHRHGMAYRPWRLSARHADLARRRRLYGPALIPAWSRSIKSVFGASVCEKRRSTGVSWLRRRQ
jgi:hypothetical protein